MCVYIYIYIVISITITIDMIVIMPCERARLLQVSVCERKHSSGERQPLECRLSEHQIRGWREVSAVILHG